MFVVTRHKGQRITLGEEIEIVVLEVSRSSVKLGVIAPKSLTILRSEVRAQIEEANREAASAASESVAIGSLPEDANRVETRLLDAANFLSAAVTDPSLPGVKTGTPE